MFEPAVRPFSGYAAAGPPDDVYGAFCCDNHASLPSAGTGPLAGLTFAAKDVFDIAGARTGYGHPDWLATHDPATETAEAVAQIVGAGAVLVGRTVCDELCYSLSGANSHYGAPRNPRAADRLAGGSSSGSAVAVAGGLVDFALGTDCGGSIRVPAAYCGVYGVRPTHGAVSLAGAYPFAPSFDTAGWLARDPALLMAIGQVLLRDQAEPRPLGRLVIAEDAFERTDANTRDALAGAVDHLASAVGRVELITVSPEGLEDWLDAFRIVQAAEIWGSLGAWISRVRPALGPGVRERFAAAAEVSKTERSAAAARCEKIFGRLHDTIAPGDMLCLPTTPGPAPRVTAGSGEVELADRRRAMALLCIAGLGGLPQVTIPAGAVDGAPVGLSVVGPRGSDLDLLRLVAGAFPSVPAESDDA